MENWDLDCFYDAKSDSTSIKVAFDQQKEKLETFKTLLTKKNSTKEAILLFQDISVWLRDMEAYIICNYAQDIADNYASSLQDQVTHLRTQINNQGIYFAQFLSSLDEKKLEALLEDAEIAPIAFWIKEQRALFEEKLSLHDETLINDFAVNGFHSWAQMWNTEIASMVFQLENKSYSFGQIENLIDDPQEEVRKKAFTCLLETFRQREANFAQILNSLNGFRETLYQKRGWKSPTKEALLENRMEKQTLKTMWNCITSFRPRMKEFLKCKAALLNKSELDWYDLEVSVGDLEKTISFSEASKFIIEHFQTFSPKMGAFAARVLKGRWIDAEDRKNKMPGGFCVAFPRFNESRILMTYSDTITNVYTLAHELGHAFHNEIVFSLPGFLQDVKMNVAETASTMAEMIVTRGAINSAKNDQEKFLILDDHLSRAIAYFMNIHARFLFEKSFFEKRKEGFIPADQINVLMEAAQKEAYYDSLGSYHPLFWAAKMHFYFSDSSFYNFPYTFGNLFSSGIYELGLTKGDFENTYISLLKDTGRMNVEDLAKKHLDVDLTKPTFWERGIDRIDQDIKMYLKLAKELTK